MNLSRDTFDEAKAKRQASDARRRRDYVARAPLHCRRSTKRGDLSGTLSSDVYGLRNSKQRKPINKVGPRTKASDAARVWLKRQFDKAGIRTCQLRLAGCFFDTSLGFAHPAKRRNLKDGELYIAALLCNPCHDIIEVGPPEEMRRIVEMLFKQTGIQPKRIAA